MRGRSLAYQDLGALHTKLGAASLDRGIDLLLHPGRLRDQRGHAGRFDPPWAVVLEAAVEHASERRRAWPRFRSSRSSFSGAASSTWRSASSSALRSPPWSRTWSPASSLR